MKKKDGLVKLLTELLKEMQDPKETNDPGPLEQRFFEDPFLTMKAYGLEPDDHDALLTLDHHKVAAHLRKQGSEACNALATRLLDEYHPPDHGFDISRGKRAYVDVDEYLNRSGHRDFAGLARMAASFGAAWPEPKQALREVWRLLSPDGKKVRFELIGEGLYPKGQVELRGADGDAGGRVLKTREVYVKSIFYTYLRTVETDYDDDWYGTWTVVFVPEGKPYEITYGSQLVLKKPGD